MANKTKIYYSDGKTPEETIRLRQEAYSNVYNEDKELIIKKVLLNLFTKDEWKNKKVLDIGCGLGIFTEFFLKMGAQVTALDVSKSVILANKTRNPKAKFVCQNAEEIELRERFDLIFAKDLIEHLKNDQKFIQNLNKYLNQDGIILLNTQNSHSFNYLFQNSIARSKGNYQWKGWDPNHYRFYSRITLKKLLVKNGFIPIKWFGSYYFPYRALEIWFKKKGKWPTCRLIEKYGLWDKFPFNIIGWNIGVLARKR